MDFNVSRVQISSSKRKQNLVSSHCSETKRHRKCLLFVKTRWRWSKVIPYWNGLNVTATIHMYREKKNIYYEYQGIARSMFGCFTSCYDYLYTIHYCNDQKIWQYCKGHRLNWINKRYHFQSSKRKPVLHLGFIPIACGSFISILFFEKFSE